MKIIKRFLIIFSLTLLFSLIIPSFASAANLSKTKLELNVGENVKLKLKGTTSKVTWTSSDKSIATVTKKGKVTAKSEGNTTVTATSDGKKYICQVAVSDKFDSDNASKSLTRKYYEYDNKVVAIITNNYDKDIKIDATAVFYDSNKSMLGKSSEYIYSLASGDTCAIEFAGPYDSNYKDVVYDSYKVNYTFSEPYALSISKNIEITYNDGADNVMVEVHNNGKKICDSAIVSIVFYKNNQVVGYDYTYADVKSPGSYDYIEFDYPYDNNYDTIYPDDYDIYINSAFYYNW